MTRVVHRFRIEPGFEPTSVTVPEGSRVVHVGLKAHASGPDVWVEIPVSDAPGLLLRQVTWSFRMFATGDRIEGSWWHEGSLVDGPLVWHVYRLDGPA